MWEIFRFELKYRLKRPATHIYFAILFLMAFCAITTDVIQVGGGAGQVKENAPTTIAFFQIILSVIPGLILASSIMGQPIIRDFKNNTASMIFSSPITKIQYLGGRFLGSFVMLLFIFTGIILGMALGYMMPWIDQEKLLPYNFWHMLQPFLLFVLPNAFIMGAIFFASGTISKKIMVVYVQGILLFIIYAVTTELMEGWENQALGALLDPFGINTNSHITRYWTVAEQNSQTVSLSGILLWNRLLWMGISILALVATYWRFNFNLAGNSSKKKRKHIVKADQSTNTAVEIPPVQQQTGFLTDLQQIAGLSLFYL